MRAQEFFKAVTMDEANLLERFIALLDEHRIAYCVIGGQAVNAYAEPLVSLDLDLVIAPDDLSALDSLLAESFTVKRFPHSLNLSTQGSDLRIQIQTDPRYAQWPAHAELRTVLGIPIRVARLGDVLQGKLWAVQDPTRRGSKRQKDLADIARLIETYPHLREQIPPDISRLLL